ncbi:MAG TPA: hypothetical protein VNO43_02110 [Candidatus Eisenbacteria bacterium]|nr:hypothetical protein [Candidatus Eisenbacteria bacterium]
MTFNPWIERAWQMHRQAACVPNTTILKAALWLEGKYRQTPSLETAAIISLHYLVLALRKHAARRPALFEYYIAEALRWRREAIRRLSERRQLPASAGEL